MNNRHPERSPPSPKNTTFRCLRGSLSAEIFSTCSSIGFPSSICAPWKPTAASQIPSAHILFEDGLCCQRFLFDSAKPPVCLQTNATNPATHVITSMGHYTGYREPCLFEVPHASFIHPSPAHRRAPGPRFRQYLSRRA